jgi:glycosyltransferase involved in cell wall biosynthesis
VRPGREAGTTKWNYAKLWNFAWDGIVGFSSAPLKVWAYIGALIAAIAFSYAIFIVLRVLITGIDIPGYASLITVILFLGGIQLLSLGILGEYIARLFLEVKGRPIYVVEGLYEHPCDVRSAEEKA